jgi:hypothetical protein
MEGCLRKGKRTCLVIWLVERRVHSVRRMSGGTVRVGVGTSAASSATHPDVPPDPRRPLQTSNSYILLNHYGRCFSSKPSLLRLELPTQSPWSRRFRGPPGLLRSSSQPRGRRPHCLGSLRSIDGLTDHSALCSVSLMCAVALRRESPHSGRGLSCGAIERGSTREEAEEDIATSAPFHQIRQLGRTGEDMEWGQWTRPGQATATFEWSCGKVRGLFGWLDRFLGLGTDQMRWSFT